MKHEVEKYGLLALDPAFTNPKTFSGEAVEDYIEQLTANCMTYWAQELMPRLAFSFYVLQNMYGLK